MPEAFVVFTPSGKRGSFPHGTTLLQAARALGVDLDSVCGGRGLCGRCQIEPSLGEFSKFRISSTPDSLNPLTEGEQRYKDKRGLEPQRRLGCQTRLQGDVLIDVPAESQTHRQVVRKAADHRPIDIDPAVRLHYVEVAEPDMHHPSGDLERVLAALQAQWEITIDGSSVSSALLADLQTTLRAGTWKITCAVRNQRDLVAVWPGFQDRLFGFAVDVGSTTISAHLTDLRSGEVVETAGAMNPQIRFGEDLMSRVSYVMMNPGGDKELTQLVRESVDALMAETCAAAQVRPDEVLEVVMVGNPVMHHLLLGFSPVELGWAPFALVTNQSLHRPARALGLSAVAEGAEVYTLPCIAGHVGADAAACILSEEPHHSESVMLLVDVGTNAEIVLGSKERLLACSSPTGPALEGAQISCGQRASVGAIERVRIDPVTLEPRFRVIGCPLWSNEEGFDEKVRAIGVTGLCGSGIIEVMAEMFLCGLITEDGIITGAERTPRIVANGRAFDYILHHKAAESGTPRGREQLEIRITQGDVRAVQLAKGALYAGAKLLIDRLGRTPDTIVLAGAFGSHIDPQYAMVLGLIPDADFAAVRPAGNAAGSGARIALLNQSRRRDIEAVVQSVEKIETAVESSFQEHFVAAMAIPNKTDPYPKLRAQITMPESTPESTPQRRASRRTRSSSGASS